MLSIRFILLVFSSFLLIQKSTYPLSPGILCTSYSNQNQPIKNNVEYFMKKTEVIFKINETEGLVVKIDDIYEIHCCYDVPIYLIQNDKELLLTDDFLKNNLEAFKYLLNKALMNKLPLHKSLKNNVGFFFNEYIQDKTGLAYEKFENRDYWVGLGYLLWNDMYATWMYNDPEGSIIIEITPLYPKKEYITTTEETILYKDWIKKSYSPYLIRTISNETAQTWLKIIENLLKQIDENIKRMEHE